MREKLLKEKKALDSAENILITQFQVSFDISATLLRRKSIRTHQKVESIKSVDLLEEIDDVNEEFLNFNLMIVDSEFKDFEKKYLEMKRLSQQKMTQKHQPQPQSKNYTDPRKRQNQKQKQVNY